MQDPTAPPPGDEWPSDPPPTPRQDHAVLAWLATEPKLPEPVQTHLLDALACLGAVDGVVSVSG